MYFVARKGREGRREEKEAGRSFEIRTNSPFRHVLFLIDLPIHVPHKQDPHAV